MKFAVITPTIGSPTLEQCIKSLRGQDCTHYIVMDGKEHFKNINTIMMQTGLTQQTKVISLEENVGKGWYGHRVYAAAAYIINADVLCYLDEDNWVEPDYIESFKQVLNTEPWAFTLRKIVDEHGTFVCDDNCESLGQWPVVGDRERYHIDTGCFAVPRDLALRVSPAWYGQWGADRQFFQAIRQVSPSFGCTRKHTLNYRLGGETSQVTKEMFLRGNQMAFEQYNGVYPWHTQQRTIPNVLTYSTTLPSNRLS